MNQLALFTDTPRPAKPSPIERRYTAMDAALDAANDEWKARYTAFILDFKARATEPFTAEDVRECFNALPGHPSTAKSQRASGGIFVRLVREGKLTPAGSKRSRRFGNLLQAYR